MFKAGFARADVTPPLGSPLAGYFRERFADGVLDPIELNAIAVSDGDSTALIITGDFLGIMLEACNELRALISEKTGVPEAHIFLQGIHQHTSCRIGRSAKISSLNDEVYLDILYRKYRDVAQMAIDDMAEATVEYAERETAEPISFIRRFKMKDGTNKTNPGCLNPDIVAPIGEADNTVRLIRFKRAGKKDIAFVNFSTHPDVISGEKLSADWPGFVRRMTEADIADVHCILLNGAQGDTNHIDVTKERTPKDKKYAQSESMGRTIADVVVDIWDKTEPVATGRVFGEIRILNIPTNTDGMERVDECIKIMDDHYAGRLETKLSLDKLGEYGRISRLYTESLFRQVPVSVVAIGDVAFVGFGGEPFTQYATAARAAAPDKKVITGCLVNGSQGYLPDETAYAEGGYEASSSPLRPEVAPRLQGAAKELLESYYAK